MTILKPALHTLWQTFVGLVAAWWGAAGLVGVTSVRNVDDAKRFALSGAAAVLAALASAAYHTARQYGPQLIVRLIPGRMNKAELATIYELLDAKINADAPLPTLTPADPAQPAAGVPPAAATAPDA